jgi:hypothetical protein
MVDMSAYSFGRWGKLGQPAHERAHAFHFNMALVLLPIDTWLILDALGCSMNCSAVAEGPKGSCSTGTMSLIPHGSTLQTFRSCLSTILPDVKSITPPLPATPTTLFPVQNGPTAAWCHQQYVRFVCVTCTVDVAPLITMLNYGMPTLRVGFCIELPQTTAVMTNHRGNSNYNLTTWHGAANLSTLTPDQLRMLILEPCLHDGPITLRTAMFNLTDVEVDNMTIIVGTLENGYVRNVPLSRIPQIQSTSQVATALTSRESHVTCYSWITLIPTWSELSCSPEVFGTIPIVPFFPLVG